jgi:CRISPR-associated protein Cmr6
MLLLEGMMSSAMREAITNLNIQASEFNKENQPFDSHTGLWLDKMLSQQVIKGETISSDSDHPTKQLMYDVHKYIREPESYRNFYERWLPSLPQKHLRVAKVIGRLVVGLGSESTWENNITLHRTYGLPYIPGSALKGLAAAYAHKYLEEGVWNKVYTKKDDQGKEIGEPIPIGNAHKIMFGDTTSEGYVTFFDALYVPGSGHQGKALWPDVITVHHPNYYQKTDSEQTAPADWDDPTPISFMSATGKYLIALDGPEEWVEAAVKILEMALTDMGVGAKTSSGYGRMKYLSTEEQEECLKKFRKEKLELPDSFKNSIKVANASSLSNKVNLLQDLPEELYNQGAELIIDRARIVFGKKVEDKPWFQKLLESVM